MFVSKTYDITDCYKVYPNTYSSTSVVNFALPSNYEIRFILNSNSSTQSSGTSNVCFMRFDSSSNGYVGKGGSSSRNICLYTSYLPNTIPVSVDTEYIFRKENNVLSLTDGTDTITMESTGYTSLYSIIGSSNGKIKDIKIIKL